MAITPNQRYWRHTYSSMWYYRSMLEWRLIVLDESGIDPDGVV